MKGSITAKGLEQLGLVRDGNSANGAGRNDLSNGRRPEPHQKGMERMERKEERSHRVASQPSVEVENEENSEGHGKRKWQEVLEVLSERFVGRREVARIRAAIWRAREEMTGHQLSRTQKSWKKAREPVSHPGIGRERMEGREWASYGAG